MVTILTPAPESTWALIQTCPDCGTVNKFDASDLTRRGRGYRSAGTYEEAWSLACPDRLCGHLSWPMRIPQRTLAEVHDRLARAAVLQANQRHGTPSLPWSTPNHKCTIHGGTSDFGDEPLYRPQCTCGWTGTPVQQRRCPGDDAAELAQFTPAHRDKIKAAGGLERFRDNDGSRYGTRGDTVTECLAHLAYRPADHLADVQAVAGDAARAIRAHQDRPSPETHTALAGAASGLIAALDRYAALNHDQSTSTPEGNQIA